MSHLTMISHFNGVGVFPLAAMQAGIQTIATTEIDPFCNAISRRLFPHAKQYTDICQTGPLPYADIICGGDPCQPHSSAGKRAGKSDARWFWPQMFGGIKAGRPAWVVNENVVGSITNGVLDTKISDLEAAGYACQAFDIAAGAHGAPHLRRRVVLVAHAMCTGRGQQHLPPLAEEQAQGRVWHRAQRPYELGPASRDATVTEILRMADGTTEGLDASERRARIKALGNAIDPHVFVPFFKAIVAACPTKEEGGPR